MALETIDVHVAGAAVRLVIAGLPALPDATFAERAASLERAAGIDLVALCREPRGHAGTAVAVLAEPDNADSDTGVVFFDGDGMLPFSGEALIGAVAIALERGLVGPRHHDVVAVETLAGAVRSRRLSAGGGSIAIGYTGSPATVVRPNQPVVFGGRNLRADLVRADSALVAIVDAEAAGAPLVPTRVFELQRAGRQLLSALDENVAVEAVVFIGAAPEHGADILSGTVLRSGQVLRSPGGTATAAVAAVLSAMGVLMQGQRLMHQGIAGTTLGAEISAVGDHDGTPWVSVDVEGAAWPIGRHEFSTSRGDPLAEGVRFA